MSIKPSQKLLKNRKVVEEINRHRWIESEKAGYDIGFDQASSDWLVKFSKAWMQYHMPKRKMVASSALKTSSGINKSSAGSSNRKQSRAKSRTAKS